MNNRQKISIALCSYNGEKYILEQLESIASQTRLPDELVICDDGSTDNTIEIIGSFSARVSFPVILQRNELNLGSTKNFEKAISLCKCDIIALSDQDDVWHPEKLQRIANVFIQKSSIAAVFTDGILVDEDLQPTGQRLWQVYKVDGFYKNWNDDGYVVKVLLRRDFITGATMAFKAEYNGIILPISNKWMHDSWIGLSLAVLSQVAFLKEPLIYYRKHSGQQIGPHTRSLIDKIRKSLDSSHYEYISAIEKYSDIVLALQKSALSPAQHNKLRYIEQKLNHYRFRADLNKAKYRRLLPIMKESINGNYFNYSHGISSAIKDLILL